MSALCGDGRPVGIERVWRLVSEGYHVTDIDSDDLFVGVRMERGGQSLTLLLTRTDFAALFPRAEYDPLDEPAL